MIFIEDLRYAYNPGDALVFPDFAVDTGEHLLLLGESGSGKTTLLHLLGGLLRAQHGKIIIGKQDISGMSEADLDRFRGQNIGFIFQRNHLISALTVEKNLLLAPMLAGLSQDLKRVREVTEQLGLAGKLQDNVKALSQGQAQRVAIARAVLNKPALILADEPTSALDDKNCDRVINLLMEMSRRNNSTLVVATHDRRLSSSFSKKYTLGS